MYIVHWKQKLNGLSGNGTSPLPKEFAKRVVKSLNKRLPYINHWLVPYKPIESFTEAMDMIIEKNRVGLKESLDNIIKETVTRIESVENNNFTAFMDYILKSLASACDIPEDLLRNKCNELDF